MEKMEYDDFKELFGKWAPLFKDFIESEKMFKIYQQLKASKERIVPLSSDVFNVFKKTDPEKVKVVWYLQDPYPRLYKNNTPQATGVAMDCSNSPDGRIQPSLQKFYEELERKMENKVEYSSSLDYLLEQGVLLINTDLTCKVNKTRSHNKLWESFQKYFLEEVMRSSTGIIYVLSGEESERMEKYINPLGNLILKTSHPASAAHTKTDWNSNNLFENIRKYLLDKKEEPIYWDRKLWEQIKDLPF